MPAEGAQPHFWVADVDATTAYYVETLGFELAYAQPDDGPKNFTILELGSAQFMFAAFPEEDGGPADFGEPGELRARASQTAPCSLYVQVLDVDAHHDRAKAQGAKIISPPEDKFWGLRQYDLADLNGHWLSFHAPLKKPS